MKNLKRTERRLCEEPEEDRKEAMKRRISIGQVQQEGHLGAD